MSAEYDARLEREKLDSMKELAYGASHEINNPLANIAARAQALLRDEAHPERRRALESIHQQAMRAHEMISDLMLFARPPALDLQPLDLSELLHAVSGQLAEECERRNVQLLVQTSALTIDGDRQQLTVAVLAVCRNALEAIGSDGVIEMSLSRQAATSEQAESAVITVHDTGPGLADEVRRHLFDPFYSGREAGRGLGFGMSKCWRIVTDHGGEVQVESELGEGTTVFLVLPVAAVSRHGGVEASG